MKYTALAFILAVLLSGCDPANACDRYGFKRGSVEFAQCIQKEETTQRLIYAKGSN
jgi:hypothetical protein